MAAEFELKHLLLQNQEDQVELYMDGLVQPAGMLISLYADGKEVEDASIRVFRASDYTGLGMPGRFIHATLDTMPSTISVYGWTEDHLVLLLRMDRQHLEPFCSQSAIEVEITGMERNEHQLIIHGWTFADPEQEAEVCVVDEEGHLLEATIERYPDENMIWRFGMDIPQDSLFTITLEKDLSKDASKKLYLLASLDDTREIVDLSEKEAHLKSAESGTRWKEQLSHFSGVNLKGIREKWGRLDKESRSLHDYDQWVKSHQPSMEKLESQKRRKMAHSPVFTVVIPADEDDQSFLSVLGSLQQQSYPEWEILLISQDRPALQDQYARELDPDYLPYSILEAEGTDWKEILMHAQGEWILFLDRDTILEPDALYELASLINQKHLDTVTFNEDEWDPQTGIYSTPLLRPALQDSMMLTANLAGSALAVRKEFFLDSLPQSRIPKALNYELLLEAQARRAEKEHLDKMLVHHLRYPQKMYERSIHENRNLAAGRIVLQNRMDQLMPGVWVEMLTPQYGGLYRLHGKNQEDPFLSVIVYAQDQPEWLDRLIQDLRFCKGVSHWELVIVDAGSKKQSTFDFYRSLRRDPQIRLTESDGQLNPAIWKNQGANMARGDRLLFLDPGIRLNENSLSELLFASTLPDAGAVSARICDPGDRIISSGAMITRDEGVVALLQNLRQDEAGTDGMNLVLRDVRAIMDGALLVDRESYTRAGGFKEDAGWYQSNADLSFSLDHMGFHQIITPNTTLYQEPKKGIHPSSKSVREARKAFMNRHSRWIGSSDPACSGLVDMHKGSFQLKGSHS